VHFAFSCEFGDIGYTRTRTRIIGYPKFRVVFFRGEYQVAIFITQILNYPTRKNQVSRTIQAYFIPSVRPAANLACVRECGTLAFLPSCGGDLCDGGRVQPRPGVRGLRAHTWRPALGLAAPQARPRRAAGGRMACGCGLYASALVAVSRARIQGRPVRRLAGSRAQVEDRGKELLAPAACCKASFWACSMEYFSWCVRASD
jgi:hypothetical protein